MLLSQLETCPERPLPRLSPVTGRKQPGGGAAVEALATPIEGSLGPQLDSDLTPLQHLN